MNSSIPAKTAYALQNKFRGSLTSGGPFWGQVSYVKTSFIEGMLLLSGTPGDEDSPCLATIHTRTDTVPVTPELAQSLLDAS